MATRKKVTPKGRRSAKKKQAGRRSSKSRRAKRSSRTKGSVLKWLLGLGLLAMLVLGGYSLYLSKTVRVKFEGKRWAVPARVYAQPLELYVGARISAEQLANELNGLGYRKVPNPQQSAQWSRNKGRFLIKTRSFQFWDESAAARYLDVRFSGGSIEQLLDVKTKRALDLVRLEPVEIGSIYPTHNEDRVLVQYSDIPNNLVKALVAVEDRHFFEHLGIDPRGLARALWTNLRAGKTVQGGSTLTQQLVKNFFLTPERSLKRKFNEVLMALILESRYEKQEIFEAYANEIFLGQDGRRAIHGFGLAAHYYFNRPLKELRLPEIALLVGLVKGASYYNPRRHPERARLRRNLVLNLMADQGFITKVQTQEAKQAGLGVTKSGRLSSSAYPAFIDLVRRQLRRDYQEEDLTSEGLRIFTTLNTWHQKKAGEILASQLQSIEKKKKIKQGSLQGSVVLVDAQGGEVTALLGGRRSNVAGFNRALDAIRPIGSLVKPAVYLAALSQPEKYNLLSSLDDTKISLKGENGKVWEPKNYDGKEHGAVPLHQALAKSYNLATVRLGMDVGLKKVGSVLRSLGVTRPVKAYPSLLLGALSLPPLEVAQIYQTFAAGGFRSPLRSIREVLDTQGEPLQRYPLTVKQAVPSGANYLVSRNLVEVVGSGTARGLSTYLPAGVEVAGKTGTTNDLRDSWFAGYSGDRVGVVWVGRDDNRPAGLTGSQGALPIWGKIMNALGVSSLVLVPPETVHHVWVDAKSGLLSGEDCPDAVAYPFIKGSEPTAQSDCLDGGGFGNFLQGLFK